jgi:hypothetical protein
MLVLSSTAKMTYLSVVGLSSEAGEGENEQQDDSGADGERGAGLPLGEIDEALIEEIEQDWQREEADEPRGVCEFEG